MSEDEKNDPEVKPTEEATDALPDTEVIEETVEEEESLEISLFDYRLILQISGIEHRERVDYIREPMKTYFRNAAGVGSF